MMPTAGRRSVSKNAAAGKRLAALVIALATFTTLLVPVPATAAPGDDDWIPSKADVEGLPEPQWPDSLWRLDERSFEEIMKDGGFEPIWKYNGVNPNDNIVDHVLNLKDPKDTNYISTSESRAAAEGFCKGEVCYMYEIAPDNDYVNVTKAFKDRLLRGGEYDEDLARSFSRVDRNWFGKVKGEREWAHEGKLDVKRIKRVEELHYSEESGTWEKQREIDRTDPDDPDSYKEPWDDDPDWEEKPIRGKDIPGSSSCYGVARASSCSVRPDDEESLQDLLRDRLDGDLNDVQLTLDVDELLESEDLLLAPGPNVLDVLADEGDDSFGAITDDLKSGFESDLDLLAEVSSDDDLVGAVADGLEITGDVGSEIVPYAGIAATGWAMREDAAEGKWGDFVADGIAEVLQGAMIADPEFAPILEPLLIADIVLKAILDEAWKLAHPAKAAEDHRNAIEKAQDQLERSPDLLLEHWGRERDAVLEKNFEEVLAVQIADSLKTRFVSDVDVIKSFRLALLAQVEQRLDYELSRAKYESDRIALRQATLDLDRAVTASARSAIEERYQQYIRMIKAMAQPLVQAAWDLDLEAIAEKFVDESSIQQYIRAVTAMPSAAYHGANWAEWSDDPGEYCVRTPKRQDAGADDARSDFVPTSIKCTVVNLREGLEQVVMNAETTWQHDAEDFRGREAEVYLIERFNSVKNEVPLPSVSGRSTTLGIHEPTIEASGGGPLTAGASGALRWNQQVEDDATGASIAVGQSLVWSVRLPRGVSAGRLPVEAPPTGWSVKWSQAGPNVSRTMTRLSGSGEAFTERMQIELPLTAAATFRPAGAVALAFDVPNGTRSLAPTGAVSLRDSEAPAAVVADVLGPQDVHNTASSYVRLQLRTTRAIARIEGLTLTMSVPDPLLLIGRDVNRALGAERRLGDAEWEAFTEGQLSVTTNTGSTLATAPRGVDLRLSGPGGLTFLPAVAAAPGQPDGVFAAQYEITGKADGAPLRIAGEVLLRSGPDGLWPVDVRSGERPSLHENAEGGLGAVLTNIGGTTKQGLAATVTAPSGSTFSRSSFDMVLTDGTTSRVPATLDYRSEVMTIDQPSFSVPGNARSSLSFPIRAAATQGSGPSTDGAFEVRGGAALPKGTTALGFTWSNVRVEQDGRPTLMPGEQGPLSVKFRNLAQTHRCGAEVVATAPTGTRFLSSTVQVRQAGGSQWLEGALGVGGRAVSFSSSSVCSSSSLVFTIQADLEERPAGVIADGRIVVRGEMTPERDAVLSWQAKEPPSATTVSQTGTVPNVVTGQTATVAIAVVNRGGGTGSGSRFRITAPAGTVFPEYRITRTDDTGREVVVPAVVADGNTTLTVDDPAFAVPAGRSTTLRVKLLSRASEWTQGVATGAFAVIGGEALPMQSVSIKVVQQLAEGRRTVFTERDGLRGEARIRSIIDGDRWRTVIEQYRITVSREHSGRRKANVNLEIRAAGRRQTAYSPDAMLQDGQWHALNLQAEQPTGGSSSKLDGTVQFVFDMPSEPGALCPILWWACLTPDPKLAAEFRVR